MILLFVLSIRLCILQLKPDDRVVLSYQNHQEENISDMKYMILDCNGKDLMTYKKTYVLVIDTKPFSLNNYEETLQGLMALNYIMKVEDEDFSFSSIMKDSGKKYYNICEDTYNKINSLKNIKGIYTYVKDSVDIKKAWSVSSMFSHILDENNEDGSLQKDLNNVLKNNENPKSQFYLDDKAVYAKHTTKINQNNKNIMLTVDKEMQNKVRDVLDKEEYRKLSNVGVTIMESDSGKVKVLEQKDESDSNINLAIGQMGYEPGSVYKIITLGTALDLGLININSTFNCNGKICKSVHGNISVEKAFEISCNDTFAQIGQKVGYNNLMKYSVNQGLYSRILNYYGNNKDEAAGVKPVQSGGMNNISIGQCMNVTPIQMMGAVNTVINNGIYVKPYIIEGISDTNDNIIKSYTVNGKRIYSETTAKILKNMMRSVVINGTGKNALIENIMTGGKTGSSTGNDNCTHGWFAGYFELDGKDYTMVVFVPELTGDNLGGGNTAAPVFKDIVVSLKNK